MATRSILWTPPSVLLSRWRRRARFWSSTMSCCTSRLFFFFFSSRRRHTRLVSDWSSDVCSSDLQQEIRQHAGLFESIDRLRGLGARFAFDDVGVAYSHLPLIERIRPSYLKIRSEERRVGKECRSRWSPYH